MIDRLFYEHPRQVGESYGEHWLSATRFGLLMVRAGVACMIHAMIPACFTRTGSGTVKQLYGEMRQRQPNFRNETPSYLTAQWQPEYEI